MSEQNAVSIKSLKTAKDVISLLVDRDGASVTEAAEQLEMPLTTTYEYFRTLDELGYIIRGEKEYYVSTLYLSIGTNVRKNNGLYNTAKTELDKLGSEIEENVSLVIEEDGYCITLYTVEENDSIQINEQAGHRVPLHVSSGGKAILANLSKERVDEIIDTVGLRPITENTITERERLMDELEQIRKDGYAVAREESIVGINGVSVPIVVDGARSIGAVHVFGPASSLTGKRLTEELPNRLENLKNILETNLTYSYYRDY